jgi:DNA-binding NarL/FixJ family response regulator
MPQSDTIRILLADDDALRRDGLAAVLSGNSGFLVIAGASDGDTALEEIRGRRPDVAVVDLNLPKLHGIELVRRVRAESLGTKIIIVAGTADDEIVREVVRAGGDGYVLKNGPARHLLDAISYVRDGGQYFSPQLHRDGRDRHLLEEPPRLPQSELSGAGDNAAGDNAAGDDSETASPRRESSRESVRGRRSRRPGRFSDPTQFRERMREESSEDLNDHDYEVMSMMAEGIRPILDRLDEIDTRVAQMETGDEPVPSNPRGWLTTQFADTLGDPRAGNEIAVLGRNVTDLESRLPELIEETVTKRFHQMADKLQQEIEETHVRTLESFVKNIQVKLVQRVSALEQDMSMQAQAMSQLRDYSQRTEDNLSRLITGVDKLAKELPQRLATGAEPEFQPARRSSTGAAPERSAYGTSAYTPSSRVTVRRSRGDRGVKIFWAAVGGVVLLGGLAFTAAHFAGTRSPGSDSAGGAAGEVSKSKPVAANADTKTKMLAAQESVERKDYAVAEDLYKQVVKAEPGNTEALKALASVLYREEKIEESAAILDKLSKN